MYLRLLSVIVGILISGHASAITVNVDFSRAFFGANSDYVSPAGEQTAGYWNTAVAGTRGLRDSTVALTGILGNFNVPSAGSSFFGGPTLDLSNPNIVLGDAYAAIGGFQYTMTGLSDGPYSLFLYARSDSEIFNDAGVDLVPLSVTNLIGEIFTYSYSVDVFGGTLALASKTPITSADRIPVTWFAGLQITNDPAPNKIPLPGTAWLLLAGVGALVATRKISA